MVEAFIDIFLETGNVHDKIVLLVLLLLLPKSLRKDYVLSFPLYLSRILALIDSGFIGSLANYTIRCCFTALFVPTS